MQHFFPLNRYPIKKLEPKLCDLGPDGEVTGKEVEKVLEKCSNKLAPGPDLVPYTVWKGNQGINGKVIPYLYNHQLKRSIHPTSMNGSPGIKLPKPSTDDYSQFQSYRVIVLMQTFFKVVERILI
jgi:hypothetical protein